jgi:hypothetical protein
MEYRSSRCKGAWGMLHLVIILRVQTQSNRLCIFHVILLWLLLPRDHFLSRFFYFKTAMAAVSSCPVLHVSVVIFFWSFGTIDASTIKCWELSTARAGAMDGRDVALIHDPICTNSIKSSLQFSCNFVVINTSEWSLFSRFLNINFCLFVNKLVCLFEFVRTLTLNFSYRTDDQIELS